MEPIATMPWETRSDDEAVGIGRHVRVAGVGDLTVVFVEGMPVRRFDRADHASLRVELAHLEAAGIVTQAQVARSGLVSEATFHRDCKGHGERSDAEARGRMGRGSKGPRKLLPMIVGQIVRLHGEGLSGVAIGAKLGMSEGSVRSALLASGLRGAKSGVQLALAAKGPVATERDASAMTSAVVEGTEVASGESSATPPAEPGEVSTLAPSAAPAPVSAIGDDAEEAQRVGAEIARQCAAQPAAAAQSVIAQRRTELSLARMGMLEEQSALFPRVTTTLYAGLLLAMALLPVTGLIDAVRAKLGQLGNGLYGVRSIVTTLVAMALLRCKRPEQLKGFDPTALGAVVGLARAPEMKTLRGKFNALANNESHVVALMRDMARRHVERVRDAVAFLYIDGHVRPYFGETRLGKTHDVTSHAVLPATTDYWLSDAKGAPLLVVVTEGNAAMTKVMPALLDEARTAVGKDAVPTVVFDRGGFSPKLFKLIQSRRFNLITYRKGKQPVIARSRFTKITVHRGGRDHETLVCDTRVRIKGFGLMRCVAALRSDGLQTHVLTTLTPEQLPTRGVLERMFSRWQQENFFKYLEESFAFDALWTYEVINGDPKRTVPNPIRRGMDRSIAALRRELAKLMASPKRAPHAAQITAIKKQIATACKERKVLPLRVSIGTVRESEGLEVLELARAPKLLGDVIKMTAFHIESMLLTAMAPHLKRALDEGRAVLADFMQLGGSLEPKSDHLLVTLNAPSAPRYAHALEKLCEHVNALDPCFPETKTKLRFRVAAPPA